jgi:hypothetical protein
VLSGTWPFTKNRNSSLFIEKGSGVSRLRWTRHVECWTRTAIAVCFNFKGELTADQFVLIESTRQYLNENRHFTFLESFRGTIHRPSAGVASRGNCFKTSGIAFQFAIL